MAIIFQRSSEVMFIDEVCDLEDIVDFLATFFAGASLAFTAFFFATLFEVACLVTFFAEASLALTAVFLAASFFVGLFLLSGVMMLPCWMIIGSLDWRIVYYMYVVQ
jgi:hypothetical protein